MMLPMPTGPWGMRWSYQLNAPVDDPLRSYPWMENYPGDVLYDWQPFYASVPPVVLNVLLQNRFRSDLGAPMGYVNGSYDSIAHADDLVELSRLKKLLADRLSPAEKAVSTEEWVQALRAWLSSGGRLPQLSRNPRPPRLRP